jgi:hypothetical protein
MRGCAMANSASRLGRLEATALGVIVFKAFAMMFEESL